MPGNYKILARMLINDLLFKMFDMELCSMSYWVEQESRTLEMNNVQNGVWHGRGDAICLASGGEGSKAFITLQQPPLFPGRSPDICSMERASSGSEHEHSWSSHSNHSEPLVPSH